MDNCTLYLEGNYHQNVSKNNMQIIYHAIVQNGKLILGWKWAKENEINACTTIDEVLAVDIVYV